MGVSTFPESDLATLQWKVDSAYKPKIGLSRNFPKEVYHGPLDYGGLGSISLYSMQEFKQIQDRRYLQKPLGNWLQTKPSQHWEAYRPANGTLSTAPDNNNPSWVEFPSLAITPNGIQYNILDSPGMLCNPPKKACKISLSSGTPNTLIYADSNSLAVTLNPHREKKDYK
mmetsp:Transcript_49159/g.96088  ORF Transcript_49159/g.96088 Transcript_49159/m.96088 type:complete len:170 (-) Transcript_49159:456-965(-)